MATAIKAIAQSIYPQVTDCRTYPDLETGLQAVTSNATGASTRFNGFVRFCLLSWSIFEAKPLLLKQLE